MGVPGRVAFSFGKELIKLPGAQVPPLRPCVQAKPRGVWMEPVSGAGFGLAVRVVSVIVVTAGSGQVAKSGKANSPPCWGGRRPWGHSVVAGGRRGTWSERNRPNKVGGQVAQDISQAGGVLAGIGHDAQFCAVARCRSTAMSL